ncbi:MAG: hypothetical protein JXL97_16285 [Bacteroidales bacterium]|nr:hypothetical protein [Bacteroidales bacterium]
MKHLLLLVFVLLSTVTFAQKHVHKKHKCEHKNQFVGTVWKINTVLGVKYDDSYTFTKFDENKLNFGNFIEFVDSVNFKSYNKAQCGNDCFVTVTGTYFLHENNIISFSVDIVGYTGMCKIKDEKRGENETFYSMEINDDDITLTKVEKDDK